MITLTSDDTAAAVWGRTITVASHAGAVWHHGGAVWHHGATVHHSGAIHELHGEHLRPERVKCLYNRAPVP